MREHGKIKFFHETKGYGFITPDDETGQDAFLHQTVCQKCGFVPLTGMRVQFEAEQSERGRKVTWVG